jgi:hypothetical protein
VPRPTRTAAPHGDRRLMRAVAAPVFTQLTPRRGLRWLSYAAMLVAMVAVAVGLWLHQPDRPSLALTATDQAGQLRIVWDRDAQPIRHAAGGSLEIDDHGTRTSLHLTPADLRSGNVSYLRQSGNVAVRLIVEQAGSAPVEETTRFLQPEKGPAAPVARQAQPPANDSAAATQPQVSQAQPAAPNAAGSTEPPPPTPSTTSPSPIAEPDGESDKLLATYHAPKWTPPQAPLKGTTATIPALTPPKLDNSSALPVAAWSPPPMLAGAPSAVPPRPKTMAIASDQTAAVASGRIIWTGKLPKNGRLVIDGSRASSGAVNGALPTGAVRVIAYAGDLTAGGITLFTADARYAQPVTEAPGAHNGWNRTVYTFDRRRAEAVRIVEQPGPQNGYKLVLKSENPKLSVVVVDWRSAQ